MINKNKKILKIGSGTLGLVSIPTATTLGFALGIKDESVDMSVKEAKTIGEKFFDENIANGSSTYVAQHLLNPDLSLGDNISYLPRLDLNMTIEKARAIIATDSKGRMKKPLVSVDIKTDQILVPSQLPEQFLEANHKLFKVVSENGASTHPKNLAIYIGKDLRTRTITAKIYEIKRLDEKTRQVADEYLRDFGSHIQSPVAKADGKYGGDDANAESILSVGGAGVHRVWSNEDPNNFLNIFAGENFLQSDQISYFPFSDGLIDNEGDMRAKWGQTGMSTNTFNQNHPDGYKIDDHGDNKGHNIIQKLVDNQLCITYQPIVDFKNKVFKIYVKYWKMDRDSKWLSRMNDQIENPIAIETKLLTTFQLSEIGNTDNINTPDNVIKLKKFLIQDLPKYTDMPIVKPGLQTLGSTIPSLKTVLDEMIKLEEIIKYRVGNVYPYQDIFTDEFIGNILDKLSADVSVDGKSFMRLVTDFESMTFNKDETKNFWSNMTNLLAAFYDNGGQFNLYTFCSGLASFVGETLDTIYKAHPEAKTILENTSIIESLLNFLRKNNIVPDDYSLSILVGSPIKEAHRILYNLGQKNLALPKDLIEQILPILSSLPKIGSFVNENNSENIKNALNKLFTDNRLSNILKLLGSTPENQIQVMEKITNGGTDMWDAIEEIASNKNITREQILAIFETLDQLKIVPDKFSIILGNTIKAADNYVKLFNNGALLEIAKLIKGIMNKGIFNINTKDITIPGVDLSSTTPLTDDDRTKISNYIISLPKFSKDLILNTLNKLTTGAFNFRTDPKTFNNIYDNNDIRSYFTSPSFTRVQLNAIKSLPMNEFTNSITQIIGKIEPILLTTTTGDSSETGALSYYINALVYVISKALSTTLTDSSPYSVANQLKQIPQSATNPQDVIIRDSQILAPLFSTPGLPSIFHQPEFVPFLDNLLSSVDEGIAHHLEKTLTDANGIPQFGETIANSFINQAMKVLFPSGFIKGNSDSKLSEQVTTADGSGFVHGLLYGFSSANEMWNSLHKVISVIPEVYHLTVKNIPLLGQIDIDLNIEQYFKDLYNNGTFVESIFLFSAKPKQELALPLQKMLKTGLFSLTKDEFKKILNSLKDPLDGASTVTGPANGEIRKIDIISKINTFIDANGADDVVETIYSLLHNPLRSLDPEKLSNLLKFIDSLGFIHSIKLEPFGKILHLVLNTGIQSLDPSDLSTITSSIGISNSITNIIQKVLYGSSSQVDVDILNAIKEKAVQTFIPSDLKTDPEIQRIYSLIPPIASPSTYASLKIDLDSQLNIIKGSTIKTAASGASVTDIENIKAANTLTMTNVKKAYAKFKLDVAGIISHNEMIKNSVKEWENLAKLIISYKMHNPAGAISVLLDSSATPPTDTYTPASHKFDVITGSTQEAITKEVMTMSYAKLIELNEAANIMIMYNNNIFRENQLFIKERKDIKELIKNIPPYVPLSTGATPISGPDYATLRGRLTLTEAQVDTSDKTILDQYRTNYLALRQYIANVHANNKELENLKREVSGMISTIPGEELLKTGANPVTDDSYVSLRAKLTLNSTSIQTATVAELKQYKIDYEAIKTRNSHVEAKNKELVDARAEAKALIIPRDIPLEAGATIVAGDYASLKKLLTDVNIDTANMDALRKYKINHHHLETFLKDVKASNDALTALKAEVNVLIAKTISFTELNAVGQTKISQLKGVTKDTLTAELNGLIAKNVSGISFVDLTQLKTDLTNKFKEIDKYNANVSRLNTGKDLGLSFNEIKTLIQNSSTKSGTHYIIRDVNVLKSLYDKGVRIYTTNSNGNPGWGWYSLKVSTIEEPVAGQYAIPWTLINNKMNEWNIKAEFTISTTTITARFNS